MKKHNLKFKVGFFYTDGFDEFECIHHDPVCSGAILKVSKDNLDGGQRNGFSSKVWDHLLVHDKSGLGCLSLHVHEVFERRRDVIQDAISYIEESRDNEVDSKDTENILESLNNQLEAHPTFVEVVITPKTRIESYIMHCTSDRLLEICPDLINDLPKDAMECEEWNNHREPPYQIAYDVMNDELCEESVRKYISLKLCEFPDEKIIINNK